MSAAESRESGAARLLIDILAGDQPDRELLIRYARTPEALSSAERAEVERLLAENPRYADRLRVLREFSAAAASQPLRTAAPAPRRRSLRRSRLVFAVLPAAAAVVFAVFYGLGQSPPGSSAPGNQVAQLPAQPPVPPAPAVELPAPPIPEPAPAPDMPVAEVPAVQPAPERPAVAAPEPAPEPREPSLLAEAPTPSAEAPSEPNLLAEAPTPPAEAPPEPSAEPEEIILVAMADLDYAAPGDLAERPRVSSALRGGALKTSLTALVPEHVGLTSRAQPSLFWHVDVLPDPSLPFTFTITDESTLETLVREELPRPESAGLQRIDLRDYGVELAPGSEYRWSVFLRPDPRQRSLDRLAQGWLRRVETAPLAGGLAEVASQAASPE